MSSDESGHVTSAHDLSDRRTSGARPTNRTFASMLGSGFVYPVTTIGHGSEVRDVTGVAIYEPTSDLADSHDVQLWLSQPERADVALLVASLAASSVPGVVLDHVPDSCDVAAVQRVTEETGVAVWCKLDGVPWIQVLDEARSVVESAGMRPGMVGGAVALGDIHRLADSLADYLGGAVIIEDARLSVLGYSIDWAGNDPGRDAAILTRSMPAEWVHYLRTTGALERLRATEDTIELDGGPFLERHRYIAPIRVDRQFGGVIWLAQGTIPLPADAAERLRVAAATAAPHLRRHLELYASERAAKAGHMRALLAGEPVSHSDIEELGLSNVAAVVLIVIRTSDAADLDDRQKERLQDAVALACRAAHSKYAVSTIGNAVYCIAAPPSTDSGNDTDFGEGLFASCSRTLNTPLHVAVTDTVDSLDDLSLLRAQADLMLESLRRHEAGNSRVTTIPIAAAALLLDRFAEVARDMQRVIPYDRVDEIRAYDLAHGSEYARTLHVYLTKNGQVPEAARTLNLHPTSLRYRLRRISELFDIDLNSPDERLLCLVLLRS
ncbi:PucR family transcriptional regulator [Rhodococcus sp. NPDC058521]|uniref:PucR family transcriptional regulator n=1 Tax=Rhodococcus sp. NPDC058521 TaxID=3346536 RepID=UPI00365177A4